MKTFIASVLAVLGMSASAEPAIEKVDVNSIQYSMPTISGDEIEYQMPSEELFEGAPQFHEDEWCQLAFFSKSRLEEIQRKLTEYKAFESKSRTGSGWKEIYVRNIPRNTFKLDIKTLESLEGASAQPSPILTTASRPLGQVKNGFTISLGEGALLYGIEQEGKVVSLAASVYSDDGNQSLTSACQVIVDGLLCPSPQPSPKGRGSFSPLSS
ncbi:MAG: hypothetical protein GY801_38190 [bacterium]|nr:hypothetical protein [bacterium]